MSNLIRKLDSESTVMQKTIAKLIQQQTNAQVGTTRSAAFVTNYKFVGVPASITNAGTISTGIP